MKIFEDSFSYANQLGQRNGAGAVYLNVFHPDIYEFLSTKKENADEKIRVKTLSLGLIVPDKYYELLKTNAPMYLFSPYDVERIYGQPFGYVDITENYDEDRKSTRLNSSHVANSYAVFCLKKKKIIRPSLYKKIPTLQNNITISFLIARKIKSYNMNK